MNIIKGDLLKLAEDGEFDVTIHGCNCLNSFGAGIARQILNNYPEAYAADCETIKGDRAKLGTFTFASVSNDKFIIINAYTQYALSYGGDVFEYEAFENILNTLSSSAPQHVRFGFPLIGCGLARGNKTRILSLIEKFSKDIAPFNSTVTVVEFA